MKFRLFRKTDFIIIAAVLIVSVAFIIFMRSGGESLTAVISVDGKTVETVNLSEITERTEYRPNDNYDVLIVAEDGKIGFENSSCPDKLCVGCGRLYRKGDTAVCLPAKTVVTITDSSLDAVTY